MPSVEHARTIAAPFDRLWPFVRDMDNWAPMVTGYQRHEKVSDTESIWHLKGELGGLTRVAEFRAKVIEWDETGRVDFVLEGMNEPVRGSGTFVAEKMDGDGESVDDARPGRSGVLQRVGHAVARFVLRAIFPRRAALAASAPRASAVAALVQTRIIFRLDLSAGGAAGPVLNLLITPMLKPVAEHLANAIAERMEAGRGTE